MNRVRVQGTDCSCITIKVPFPLFSWLCESSRTRTDVFRSRIEPGKPLFYVALFFIACLFFFFSDSNAEDYVLLWRGGLYTSISLLWCPIIHLSFFPILRETCIFLFNSPRQYKVAMPTRLIGNWAMPIRLNGQMSNAHSFNWENGQ